MLKVIALLTASNIFMTIAWYGHLRFTQVQLWKVILLSWAIAFVEYCLMIPANRLGAQQGISAFQLKMIQEVVTLIIFCLFATLYLKEGFRVNYLISFCFIIGAVFFMFKK